MTRGVVAEPTAFFAASQNKENNQGRREAWNGIAVAANSFKLCCE
jgi:hypothetical protein